MTKKPKPLTLQSPKLQKIVVRYHTRSHNVAGPALAKLQAEMFRKLQAAGYASSPRTLADQLRHLRPTLQLTWGMPQNEQDRHDKALFAKLRKTKTTFPSKRALRQHVGPQLQTPLRNPDSVRDRIAALGITEANYVAAPGSNAERQTLPAAAGRHLAFAEVWNNKQVRVRHELQAALTPADEPRLTWKQVWRKREQYKRYRTAHPELHAILPPLIVRQYNTGEPKDLHPFVEKHLDEWKYDRTRINTAAGFVVGNYQWGAIPNTELIAAVKQYAAERGFEFVVGLSQYGRIEQHRDTDELITVLPEELKGHIVVDDVLMVDTKLDCNTHLVQTSDVYLTDSVCEIAGTQSTIFLGTKQEMRHWMRLEHEYPACYLTTGSLNYPHHKRTRLGKNNKAVAVARHRHEYGFVVLEVVNKTSHHDAFTIPRQLWATEEGCFYDIDAVHGGARWYTPTGSVHVPDGIDTLKDGDLHEAGVDEEIWAITHEHPDSISTVLQPLHVHLGDTFDNKWGNPFRQKQTVRAAFQAHNGMNNIRAELDRCVERLKRLRAALPARTTTITHEPSNHSDDWLQRWINQGKLQDDPLNSPLLCELWLAVYHELDRESRSIADKDAVEEKSPFGLYIRSKLPYIECPSYQELDTVMRPLPGPEVQRRIFMSHGHIGPKGMDTRSIRAFAAFNSSAAGGHVHSAARLNGHDQVGVMTPRRKHYIRGPKTNWTNSHLGVFKNGFTAHLFIIHGRWYGDSVRDARHTRAKTKPSAA